VLVRKLGAGLLVMAIAAIAASVADAAPGKPYTIVVESPMFAGVTDGAYTVTLTNKTGTQQFGSANVTIPSQLTIVGEPSTSRGVVSRSGRLLILRDLAMPPDASVTVTLGLRMPCATGEPSYAWSVQAKQSNDFSGEPGNDLGPVSGTLSTTVKGTCKLRFVGQPAGTQKDERIRADAFDENSAQLVSVEAIDGSLVPQRLTWFTGPVAIAASPGSFSASAPATVADGLFSFAGLEIGLAGLYTLHATSTGLDSATSNEFQVVDLEETCTETRCDATLAGPSTSSTLSGVLGPGDTGHVLLSLNVGTEPECVGYVSPIDEWYEFTVTAERDKTIAVTYSKAAMRRAKGPSSLEICFASPAPFTAKTGPAVPFDYDGDSGNGDEGFVGLLPDCPATPSAPCVLSRGGGGKGTAVVEFFVPGTLGDPRYN
jgi:hypothetical protein